MAWNQEYAQDPARCPECGHEDRFAAEGPEFYLDTVSFECRCEACGAKWDETYRLEVRANAASDFAIIK